MHLVCPSCGATNRVSEERLREAPVRGSWATPPMAAEPVNLCDDALSRFITGTDPLSWIQQHLRQESV